MRSAPASGCAPRPSEQPARPGAVPTLTQAAWTIGTMAQIPALPDPTFHTTETEALAQVQLPADASAGPARPFRAIW